MNYKKGNILVIVLVLSLLTSLGLAGYFFLKIQKLESESGVDQGEVEIKVSPTPVPLIQDEMKDWKTYKNERFEFKYPSKFQLSSKDGKVFLGHSIPYKNSGDCDMKGGNEIFDTLKDFGVSFEIVPQYVQPSYFDGEYRSGSLKGFKAYQGAEGCGYTTYYFQIENGGGLTVTKDSIQALSDVIAQPKRDEVLKVPGVITPEESQQLFDKILLTFKFLDADKKCVRTGSAGEACLDAKSAQDRMFPAYVPAGSECYKNAVCKVQADGECGWTQSKELTSCLAQYK